MLMRIQRSCRGPPEQPPAPGDRPRCFLDCETRPVTHIEGTLPSEGESATWTDTGTTCICDFY